MSESKSENSGGEKGKEQPASHDNDIAPEKDKKRHWEWAFFAVVFLGISGASTVFALALNYLKCSLDFLIGTAVVSTGCTLIGLGFLNIWSTKIANIVNKNYSDKVDKKNGTNEREHLGENKYPEMIEDKSNMLEDEVIYKLGCSYCGEKGKRLVCGSCNSILWYKINGFYHKIGFFAAHRRDLVNGVILSALVVTPLTFLYQLLDKKVEAYKIYEEKTYEAREALNRSREVLIKLENLDLAYLTDTDGLLKKRLELVDEFHESYMKASWLAPQVLSYFGWEYFNGNPSEVSKFIINCINGITKWCASIINWLVSLVTKNEDDSSQKNSSEYDLTMYWKILSKKWEIKKTDTKYDYVDFFKALDEDYKNYLIVADSFFRYTYFEPDEQLANDYAKRRCDAAKVFYKKGQLIGCLLLHASFDRVRLQFDVKL